MHRILTIAASFVFLALCGCATQPGGTGWVTLIDGESGLQNFTQLGAANWTAVNGAIQADKKTTADAGILLSKDSYKDLEVYAEFWADEEANSGIYIRVMNQKVVNTRAAYEIQIWDKSPTMATASLMPPAKAAPSFKAAGKWNTMEISARGPRMTVKMNGEQAVDVSDTAFTHGPVALQYNAGTIRFRKVMVRPL